MITIHITAADIAHGIVRSSRFCPVARAIERAIYERCPHDRAVRCLVFVYSEYVALVNTYLNALIFGASSIIARFPLPKAIQNFVQEFDKPDPMEFSLLGSCEPPRLVPQSFELPGLEEAILKLCLYSTIADQTLVAGPEPELVEV